MLDSPAKTVKLTLACLLSVLLTGCASPRDPQDPLQGYNRAMFKFNRGVDKVVLRPLAKVYDTVTPKFVQARVNNFYDNINLIPSVANDILQFQGYHMFADASRFVVNSTFGIGGLFDPASKINLPYHSNDLGITLAKYGMRKSPYFMIPILGPSTIRDGIGMIGNTYMTPYPYINTTVAYSMFGLYVVKKRASLLPTDKLVDEAFDPYILVRNAYLQNRNHAIDVALGQSDGADTFVPSDGNSNSTTNSNATNVSSSSGEAATTATTTQTDVNMNNKTANNATKTENSKQNKIVSKTNSKNSIEATNKTAQANTNPNIPNR